MAFKLTNAEREAYKLKPVEGVPAAEFTLEPERAIQLYAAILRGEEKPDNLTRAEEVNWDLIAREVAEAPPDTQWRIPGL